MKVSYRWLGEFVDLEGIEVEDVPRALTALGLAVEEVVSRGDDRVLDVDVTTNRPDCLNHLGLARELAARFSRSLVRPDTSAPRAEDESSQTTVTIEDPDLGPRYAARVIHGLGVADSPPWMQERLDALGQRPVNNIVDITNYVMLELGHPLHAFDYNKLEENRIVVRRAREGEKLVTLDGVERVLDSSMLAICDARAPVALAGIMGGLDSEVSDQTTSILVESAFFDPRSIRQTSKSLEMATEASFRFERRADPEMPVRALNRVCRLVEKFAGGRVAGPVVDEYPGRQKRVSLRLRGERIRRVVGVSIPEDFVVATLQALEFSVSPAEDGHQVEVPSFRSDMAVEDDLVEEVARHYGYDRIEGTYPAATDIGRFLPTDGQERRITDALESLGFLEVFNYPFTNLEREAGFWEAVPERVALSNPLSEEDSHLRASLLPGLVENLRFNLNRGSQDLRLFEIGSVFSREEGRVRESWSLGMAASGLYHKPLRGGRAEPYGFAHLKGAVEGVLESLDLRPRFESDPALELLHSGKAARILLDGETIGTLGELHPRIEQACKLRQPAFVAEIELRRPYSKPLKTRLYADLGRHPSIQNDLSFAIDKELEYARILESIEKLQIAVLQSIRLIDLYQGPNLPEGKASLTIRLTFADPERTLTQEEVNEHTERVFSVLEEAFSVERRS